MRRLLYVLPVAILLVVVGIGLFRTRAEPTLGEPAPRFSLPSLEDPEAEIALDDLRGRPVVLNFWASWCEPCRDEAELLADAARRFDDVAFLGVNILDGREEALSYVEEFGVTYPSVFDANGRIADRFAVTGAPETFFLDREQNVVGRFIGAFQEGQLPDLVQRLLELRSGDVLRITDRGETRPVP